MTENYKSYLLKQIKKWEEDIELYERYLDSKDLSFDGKYGAKEYISMARNNIDEINLKLNRLNKGNI
ncbi:hypothetical protein [Prochlorococcus sp. MIT 1223]|uniref:hypothetical protein n=1 Tax=Prochlorococcus sp. MIT 1223 TaxID=3096217 RepID=UPI002A763006|nr:hypothetical protein [Prochlorococcus sp. MIT 1223]